ncbi:protein of unknown function [Desulfatibacillum alkenivorans DSM 16219]|uniref:DUF1788 domain-containing protein n=1 Tax=Desulfatibacillum alkenivorans DSM 16219 TaxID=1121393 RepID=A0A1M6N5L5_9BACT|nr:BREX protein BrxB domain-containing protein [Desulfatibacillum alkenivorans]SHJ90923.1 protein of unknown function [Desulfatibacillum alkenivorans DSM 16219]
MSSLDRCLKNLEEDLVSDPMRISAYHDLPFAIFRYGPEDEFELRQKLRLFAFGLDQNHGRNVHFISLSELVWKVIAEEQGLDYLVKVEKTRGFKAAQDHVNSLLSSPHFRPIADEVLKCMEGLNPDKDLVFLVRAGGFAPVIYRPSVLLDELHQRTMAPTIFFYPGSAKGQTDLCFYNLPGSGGAGAYNYRVKVYGAEA